MSRPRALALACTCLALATTISAAPSDPKPLDPYAELQAANDRLAQENLNLKRQIEDLKAANRDLERRLGQPRARILPAPVPDEREFRNFPQAPNVPQPFQMPGTERRSTAPGQGWIPRDFNGQTVYIVPCEAGGAASTPTAAVTRGATAAPTTKPTTAAPAPPKR